MYEALWLVIVAFHCIHSLVIFLLTVHEVHPVQNLLLMNFSGNRRLLSILVTLFRTSTITKTTIVHFLFWSFLGKNLASQKSFSLGRSRQLGRQLFCDHNISIRLSLPSSQLKIAIKSTMVTGIAQKICKALFPLWSLKKKDSQLAILKLIN